jgi:uncharacterized membrane protein YhaH (DUF805 family)
MSRRIQNPKIMNWYLQVIKKYAVFTGRARRKEFWMYVLFNIIVSIVAAVIDNVIGTNISILPYGYVFMVYNLFVIIPSLAVSVRRMHDIGKSGWMILVGLIPIIGGIWLLVLFVMDSKPGDNNWGANPKAVGAAASVSA